MNKISEKLKRINKEPNKHTTTKKGINMRHLLQLVPKGDLLGLSTPRPITLGGLNELELEEA